MFKVHISSQQELLLSCCSFDHVSSDINIISYDYCCVSSVSLFINLGHPRDFTSHTSRRGTFVIYTYLPPPCLLGFKLVIEGWEHDINQRLRCCAGAKIRVKIAVLRSSRREAGFAQRNTRFLARNIFRPRRFLVVARLFSPEAFLFFKNLFSNSP